MTLPAPDKSSSPPTGFSVDPLSSPRVLIVDDDQDMLNMLRVVIKRKCECSVELAESGDRAWSLLENWRPDVILTDIKMPGLDGLALLHRVKEKDSTISVIIMTGHASITLAINALREGAYDFFEKPFDKDQIIRAIQRSLERTGLLRENRLLQEKLAGRGQFQGLVGQSPPLRQVQELIARIAPTDVTVLIRGRSGTGKELAARAIHALSDRADRKMVTVNCPALPEYILESELFGYVKGAFTGATRDKKGLFLEAAGSTILLDEIGDISPALQVKLLRVLQEKEIMPLGQNKNIRVDVRVLASTNLDLEERISQGLFREDLFYRLNMVTVTMPALSEIPEDIPLLAHHFLRLYAKEYNRGRISFDSEVLMHFIGCRWQGNVRELQNVIRRAVLLTPGNQISLADLERPGTCDVPAGKKICNSLDGLTYNEAKQEIITEFTRDYLTRILSENSGNVSAAARDSGLGRQTLQRLMRRYDLRAENFRSSPLPE